MGAAVVARTEAAVVETQSSMISHSLCSPLSVDAGLVGF
jgi:hypothetical protein